MSRQTDYRITLRLKPDEYAQLQAMSGNKPLSETARKRIFGETVSKRAVKTRRVNGDRKTFAKLLALLGPHDRVTAFKRIADQVENGVCDSDDETKALIRETRDWLKRIHTLLMKMLGVSES
ncbi:MAG: hypothetical protein ACSHXB_14990 [Sulfitobacter sp.]